MKSEEKKPRTAAIEGRRLLFAPTRRPLPYPSKGFAIVIVLVFIVLLTGLILAYFSRSVADRQLSNSSINQARADGLARSALDIITGNLKQELLASTNGSAITIGNTTINVNAEVMPVRNGTPAIVSGTNPIPTLLRISSANPIASDPFTASSAISTGTSANGRSISAARWNQHYLIPRLSATSTALDSTPVVTFTPPSWVYVTGSGGPAPALASPTNSVIGRYAYAIYDESALLDVNAAGYPIVSGTAPPYVPSAQQAQYAGKGALAFADLTALGLSGSSVNAIVGWRNYATLSGTIGVSMGAFPAFSYLTGSANAPVVAPAYFGLVESNTSGFLAVNGMTFGNQTDQAVFSRQELINLMTKGIATASTSGTLQNALQYLGTFSRALTAPSWSPTADAANMPNPAGNFYSPGLPAATGNNGTGSIYAYKTNAETAGFANRDIPNVRFPNPGAITHYNDDGTTSSYNVKAGDSAVQHRFSLSRLSWLPHNGSTLSSPMAQAVKDCFGLQWGADAYNNPCWMYIHGTAPNITTPVTSGTATPNQILTLDQVAALSPAREPDFFELLKAGILSGSLGRDPGACVNTYSGSLPWPEGCGGLSFDKAGVVKDAQIIQIGANIIDQSGSTSYPTAIFFQGNNIDKLSVPENGPLNVFYGVKNLPYLSKIFYIGWCPNGPAPSAEFSGWIQPELWDPFQAPTAATTRPTAFCAQVYGTIQMGPKAGGSARVFALTIPAWDYDSGGNGANEATIYYNDPGSLASGTSPSAFANPQLLTASYQDTSEGTTPAINIAPLPSSPGNPYDPYWNPSSPPAYNQFLGFHCGETPFGATTGTAPDQNHTWVHDGPLYSSSTDKITGVVTVTGTSTVWLDMGYEADPTFAVCLKYYDGTRFLPYTYMSRIVDSCYGDTWANSPATAVGTPYDTVWGRSETEAIPFMHTDPLTDRFSGSTLDGSHGGGGAGKDGVTWEWGGWPGYAGEYDGPSTSGSQNNLPQAFFYDYTGYVGGGTPPPVFPNSTNGIPVWTDPGGSTNLWYGAWGQNQPELSGTTPMDAYYFDQDGIVRPGNDCLWNTTNKIDGLSQLGNGYSITTGTTTGGASPTHTMGRRPLVLNRAFQSVGELGYVYRDLPFKTLDFFTAYSADSPLLDLFSVKDQLSVAAGQVNPNNAPPPVLQAILSGAGKQVALPAYDLNAETRNLGAAIATCIATAGPGVIGNRADLVNKLGVVLQSGTCLVTGTTSVIRTGFSTSANKAGDQADKTFLEAPIRALSDVTNTRTWNLMIDVVAQAGTFKPNASDIQKDFIVQGERRYWLHIAIDRFTGKVIDQQLELVYE